jgi:hypothetical protein
MFACRWGSWRTRDKGLPEGAIAGGKKTAPIMLLAKRGDIDNKVFNAIFDQLLEVQVDRIDAHPGEELGAGLQDVPAVLHELTEGVFGPSISTLGLKSRAPSAAPVSEAAGAAGQVGHVGAPR